MKFKPYDITFSRGSTFKPKEGLFEFAAIHCIMGYYYFIKQEELLAEVLFYNNLPIEQFTSKGSERFPGYKPIFSLNCRGLLEELHEVLCNYNDLSEEDKKFIKLLTLPDKDIQIFAFDYLKNLKNLNYNELAKNK